MPEGNFQEIAWMVSGILGLFFGGIIAWLAAANRIRSKFSTNLTDAENRAYTAEGTMVELRAQLKKAGEDFEGLRVKLDVEKEEKVRAMTQLEETSQRLDEERKLLDDAKAKLTDTFKALAGDSLNKNNEVFLKLAKESLDKILAEGRTDLDKRQTAIDVLVKPLSESLKRYEDHVISLEQNRQKAYITLEEHIKTLSASQQQLQKETGNLVTALRAPQVRGRWGEMTLKRTVELAGLSEHCDFTEQVTVQTDEGRIRPDLIVHLPGEREIVVDSKVALNAYLDAVSADSEEERLRLLTQHARQFRDHINSLGSKEYWSQFEKAPDIVVMFVPGDSFLAAAADRDHSLIEDGMNKKVILATPTTLIGLLRAVAYGWRQEQIAKNAQEISDLGKQVYERMKVLIDHLNDIGKGLEKANTSYNKAVGSLEARVLPAARRFKDLGAVSGNDIPVVEPIESTPRISNPPNLNE
ncbi:MAG: DNA recombination protein RmuC [Nitrospinaceae bacterium]